LRADLLRDCFIVAVKDRLPLSVSGGLGMLGRSDEVSEHDRTEFAFRPGEPRFAEHEARDLRQERVDVFAKSVEVGSG
jgi:hypothetical protein